MNHPPDRISGGGSSCRFGIHAKPPIKGGTDFFWIEISSSPDFVECEETLGLPFPEGPKSRTGCFAWEYDLDAVFCADELLGVGHGERMRPNFSPSS